MLAMNHLSFAQEGTKKNQQTKEQKELEDANKKKIKDLYTEAQKAAKTNKGEAISLYNEIVSIDPDFSDAYLKLADIYAEENDYNSALSAIGFYKKYLELKPKDPNVKTLKVKVSLLEEKLKSMDENSQADKNITLNDVSVEETNVFDEAAFSENYLKGRWVSGLFSLEDGRETWILDIDIIRNEIRVKIYPAAAIARARLLFYFSSNQNSNNYLDAFVTSTAAGTIDENNAFNFKYEIDYTYIPKEKVSSNGYWGNLFRLAGGKYSDLLGRFGDHFDGIHDMEVNEWNANKGSMEVHTYACYDFNLKPTKAGLKGTVKILRLQKMQEGEKILVDEIEECNLFKVNSNHNGFTFARPNSKDKIKEKTDNYNPLIKIYEARSKKNDDAMNDLGYLYLNCTSWLDVPNADSYWKKALKYFEYSANKDNTTAMRNMAIMYRYGLGMKQKDVLKAIEWYKKASDMGDIDAMIELATLYLRGEHTDYEKAKELCRQAAEKGNTDALCRMGWMFTEGMGVPKNYAVALEYYVEAANKGNTTALNAIANAYKNGFGINRNYTEAFNWYMKSANLGNITAMHELSNMYLTGLGVEKDFFEAMNWRRKLLEAGTDNRIGFSVSEIPYNF